ncbi:hypothetical protein RUND412_010643 [Rhizina undulata]
MVDFIVFSVGSSGIALICYLFWVLTMSVTGSSDASIPLAVSMFFGWDYVPWLIFSALFSFLPVMAIILVRKTTKKAGSETNFFNNVWRTIIDAQVTISKILTTSFYFVSRVVVNLLNSEVKPGTQRLPAPPIPTPRRRNPAPTNSLSSVQLLQNNVNYSGFIDYKFGERYTGENLNRLENLLADVPTRRKQAQKEIAEEDQQKAEEIDRKTKEAQFWEEREERLRREEKWRRARATDLEAEESNRGNHQKFAPSNPLSSFHEAQIMMPETSAKYPGKDVLRAEKRAKMAGMKERRRVWYNADKEKRDQEDREYNSRLQDPNYWAKKKDQIAEDLIDERKEEEWKRNQEIKEARNRRVGQRHDEEEHHILFLQWRSGKDRKEELIKEQLWWEERPPSVEDMERAERAQTELQILNAYRLAETLNPQKRDIILNNNDEFEFRGEAIQMMKRLAKKREADEKKRRQMA